MMRCKDELELPPGFRFHPSDEELVTHYLCRKCAGMPISVPIIVDVNLYKFDPWDLPGMAVYGEKEWYFFSPRDRKYPNGSRPNRAAGSGYWKATGADKAIGVPGPLGIKKALVFYAGKAPRGEKTNWIMHEYRLAFVDRSTPRKSNTLRLDDWVLCRIYNKKGCLDKHVSANSNQNQKGIGWDHKAEQTNLISPEVKPILPLMDMVQFNASDSIPRLNADSSCSENVLSSDFTCEREVQSQPKWEQWDKALEVTYINEICPQMFSNIGPTPASFDPGFRDPIQDILMYLQKPF